MSGGITSGHRDRRQPATTVNDRNDEMTTNTTDHESILNRSTEMQLMHEAMARAHCQARFEEVRASNRAYRLVAAARAQRRAEQAAMRARRLMAAAVLR